MIRDFLEPGDLAQIPSGAYLWGDGVGSGHVATWQHCIILELTGKPGSDVAFVKMLTTNGIIYAFAHELKRHG